MEDVVEAGAGQRLTDAVLDALTCEEWRSEPSLVAPTLFVVMDASSSMDEAADNTGWVGKWSLTRDGLAAAFDAMPNALLVGLLGYPNMVVDEACVNTEALFAAEALSSGREELLAALNAIQTEPCTPTYDAYAAAAAHLSSAEGAGLQSILLVTDGQPTIASGCESQDGTCSASLAGDAAINEVIAAVTDANTSHGIRTFMAGVPGSEKHMETGLDNRWWLSRVAEAGGLPWAAATTIRSRTATTI